MTNESLVTRARNYLCDMFMQSKASHMLFVDADIGFSAQDVFELLILQTQNPEYQVIGGMYKKKSLSSGYAINWDGEIDLASKEPVEVSGIGTGFMMIEREVFLLLNMHFPHFAYRPDDAEGEFDGRREIMQYFQAEIDPVSKRYLSEDFWFSRRCKEVGIRTWLCPWMKLAARRHTYF